MMTRGLERIQDERLFKALTGVSRTEFQPLWPVVITSEQELQQETDETEKARRQRQSGGGQKGKLPTRARKLFFIRYSWKVYPTSDVFGFQFGRDRSKADTNVQALWPVLERTREKLAVLPVRSCSRVEDLQAAFEGLQDLLVDATERPHARPKDEGEQRKK